MSEPTDAALDALVKDLQVWGHFSDERKAAADAITALRATVKDCEDVLADKRRLARAIDVAMHGEDGAAQQASLCDLVHPAAMLRAENAALRTEVDQLKMAVKSSGKVIVDMAGLPTPSAEFMAAMMPAFEGVAVQEMQKQIASHQREVDDARAAYARGVHDAAAWLKGQSLTDDEKGQGITFRDDYPEFAATALLTALLPQAGGGEG